MSLLSFSTIPETARCGIHSPRDKPASSDIRDSNGHEVTYGLMFTAGDDELRPALTPQPRKGRGNTQR